MQSLVSLEGYDPELRSYLLDHRWPRIMEALLTGLSVMLPWNPWQFVQEKLEYLRQEQVTDIQWDMFVDPAMRPCLLRRGMMDSLFDESDQLPQEVLEKVFDFRKKKLLGLCFRGWLAFHHAEGEEREQLMTKTAWAKDHYVTTTRRKIFTRWKGYTSLKKARREAGCAKLVALAHRALTLRLFQAWLEDCKEVCRARHWFELQGEGGEGEAEEEWCWPDGEDPVSSLPREVAIMILSAVGISGLCRCACVCRSWKDITEEPQLWNRVDLHPIGPFVTDAAALRMLQKYRPLLVHLNLRRCGFLTADSLKMIGQCQNLQDLNLSECEGLTDVAMENIARGCTGLIYLNLSYCCVNDSIIQKLTKHCVSLNYLSLAYCTQFTTKGLHSIVGGKGCRRVVYLDLSGCTQLTEEGMRYIGRGCPILNTLLLNDLPGITDTMLQKLVENCRTLRHVSLLGSSSLSDRCFKYVALDNRKLRSIKIENNSMLTDNTLRSLGKACRDLQHVYVAGCFRISDQGVKGLSHLKKLQVLNIADCTKISDAGVRHIIESASGSHLRELNLTNCAKISDVTLLRMSQSCKSLTYLSFCYCDHISDTGVDLLGHIPTLTSLDLSGCNITDQGIASLHRNPQFRHLILAELLDITDDGLQKMCSTLVKLETLDLSDCENITDRGTQSIAFNCHLLRTLSTANCEQVTDEGARYLSQGCSYLTRLDMSGCSLTDKALKHLRKGCTGLKRLDILCCVNVTREAVQRFQKKGVEVNYNTDRPKYVQQQLSVLERI